MRVHIKRNKLLQQVEIYVIESRTTWLTVESWDAIDAVEVPEGSEGPAFLILPEFLWEAIVKELPDPEESFVKAVLAREQNRLDKFIDYSLRT